MNRYRTDEERSADHKAAWHWGTIAALLVLPFVAWFAWKVVEHVLFVGC